MRRSTCTLVLALTLPFLAAAATAPRHMGDIVSPHKGDKCSACRMVAYRHPQAGLPPDVQKMRLAIMDAAIHCDTNKLEKLALDGRKSFDFNWAHVKRPGPWWKSQDAAGHRTLGKIVSTLHLPFVHQGHAFIWPSAYGDDPSDHDWEMLGMLYSKNDIVLFQKHGGFFGMRIAIVDDGDWIYAIEGTT